MCYGVWNDVALYRAYHIYDRPSTMIRSVVERCRDQCHSESSVFKTFPVYKFDTLSPVVPGDMIVIVRLR